MLLFCNVAGGLVVTKDTVRNGEVVQHPVRTGRTFLGNYAILATNAVLYKKVNFDPVADFAPIGLIGSQAKILVVNPALPAKSMAELIALAKAGPGTLDDAAVKKSLDDLGADIIGGSPEQFAAYIKSEIPKWTAIINALGTKLD